MIETREEREAIDLLMDPPVKVLQSRMNFHKQQLVSYNPTNHGFQLTHSARKALVKQGVVEALYKRQCRVWFPKSGKRETIRYSQLIIID